jgi:hypothetical protein
MGIHVQINRTKDGKFRAAGLFEHEGKVAYGDTEEQAFYRLIVYKIASLIYVLNDPASRVVVDAESNQKKKKSRRG